MKRSYFAVIAFVVVLGLVSPALAAGPQSSRALGQPGSCDINHVFRFLNLWLVFPTGADDTPNLQCAFDNAALKKGSNVALTVGTYYTGQVAVLGFVGTFRGSGMDQTSIKTLDRTLKVTSENFFMSPPTPEGGSNPWPSIFAFVGGDIVISDLSFYTTPNVSTTGWTLTGLGITVRELANAFMVVGPVVPGQDYTEANAAFHRVRIEGLPKEGTLVGYNLINGIYYEGFLGGNYGETLPLKGKFDTHDAHFRYVGGGTNLYNLYGSHISISRNHYMDSLECMDIGGGIVHTTYEFSDNECLNNLAWGVNAYGPFTASTFKVKNNMITGGSLGVYLDDTVTFGKQMKCEILHNGVENVADLGIYLGRGTAQCSVICDDRTETVVNLGTDNKLIGCQEAAGSGTDKASTNLKRRIHSLRTH